jgi:hypothetical protein
MAMMLRSSLRMSAALLFCGALSTSYGQVAATPNQPAAPAPSARIEPALRGLKQALQSIAVEKWKAPKPVRDTTGTNLNSIKRDIAETMPGLLSAADAAPKSVAALLPVERNLSALYDVVLRVTVVAEAAAPPDQADALESAMTSLDSGRRSFADDLQAVADAQERDVAELQKALSPPPSPTPPPLVCPPPPAPTKKKKSAPKPAPAAPPG